MIRDGSPIPTPPGSVGLGTLKLTFPFDLMHPSGYSIGHTVEVILADVGVSLPTVQIEFYDSPLSSDERREVFERVNNAILTETIRRMVSVSR